MKGIRKSAMRLSLNSLWYALDFTEATWSFQERLSSNIIPRYFACDTVSIAYGML